MENKQEVKLDGVTEEFAEFVSMYETLIALEGANNRRSARREQIRKVDKKLKDDPKARQAQLHQKAVERRRKRKRGGKK